MSEQDSPWKEALERYLPAFLALYFPAVHEAIGSWRIRLVRELYERGLSRDDVLQLCHVIDWMMDLPPALEQLFKSQVDQIEEEIRMPYVTSMERLARREGQAEMLIRVLQHRYQVAVPEVMAARIRGAIDAVLLEQWLDLAFGAATLEEFQQRMQA